MNKYLILLLISFSIYNINAQEVKEPEYLGDIIYVSKGHSTPLEKQKASISTKAGASVYATGIGNVKSRNVVKGLKSPVRVDPQSQISFIVKVENNKINPKELINVFKLEQKEKKKADKCCRFIELSNSGTFTGVSSNDHDFLDFKAKKYGESSFYITLFFPIEPGEYAITIEGTRQTFNLFGIG